MDLSARRVVRWAAAAAATAVVSVPASAAALPRAAALPPSIVLTPSAGTVGDVVDVTGQGWPNLSGGQVTARWGSGDSLMESDLQLDGGALGGTVTIPGDAIGGVSVDVVVCADWTSSTPPTPFSVCARQAFFVEPRLAVDPTRAVRGSAVDVAGSWATVAAPGGAHEVVWLPGATVIGEVAITGSGTITGSATIPLAAPDGPGELGVCYLDADVGHVCVKAAVEVLPATITADPAEVEPGAQVAITGRGWCCPRAPVSVREASTGDEWGGGAIDDRGALDTHATVPDDARDGTFQLEVCVLRQSCRTVTIAVRRPPVTTTSSTTSTPTTTSSTSTTVATTIAATTAAPVPTVPPPTVPPPTVPPHPPPPRHRGPSPAVGGAVVTTGALLLVGSLLWLRPSRRHHLPVGQAGRVMPRPDLGQQAVAGRNGPVVVVGASLVPGPATFTLHSRRQ